MAVDGNAIRNIKKTSTSGASRDMSFSAKHELVSKPSGIRNVTSQQKNTPKATDPIRRLSADRSDLLQRNVTKNVRVSTMPGAPTNQRDHGRKTVDETFTSQYATKGVQPPTYDEATTPERHLEPTFTAEPPTAAAAPLPPQRKNGLQKLRQMRRIGKASTLRRGAKQLKATTVTAGIWSWSIPLYFALQLPLAILTTVFFGVAIAVDTIFAASSVEGQKGFWDGVWNTAKKVITEAFEAINSITSYFFGIDIGTLHPGGLFFATYGLFLGIFLLHLLIIYLIYKIAFINPIFSRESGQKPTMFLLAVIGLSIPVLNLLPWAIFWTVAVWKNPK